MRSFLCAMALFILFLPGCRSFPPEAERSLSPTVKSRDEAPAASARASAAVEQRFFTEDIPAELSLERAIALLEINPELAAAENRVNAAAGNRLQASFWPNPKVSVGFEELPVDTYEWSEARTKFQVAQEFELGGKRSARTELAEKRKALAESELDLLLSRKQLGVILGFNQVLFVQENIKILRAILEATETLYRVASTKYQKGKISKREFLHFDIAQSDANLSYENARAELEPSLAALAAAIGFPSVHFPVTSCEGSLAEQAAAYSGADFLGPIQSQLLDSNPAILVTSEKVRVAEQSIVNEKARRWPNLTVGLMFGRMGLRDKTGAGLSLGMPIPIWDANSGSIRAALSQKNASEDVLAEKKNQVMSEFEGWRERFTTASRSETTYGENILPKAKESYEISLAAFKGERFAYDETLDPLIALLRARKAHLFWLKQLTDAAAQLKALAGID